MCNTIWLLAFAAFWFLSNCMAVSALNSRASLPPQTKVAFLGRTTSNLPNIFRDGGGGGKINGLNFMIFSDGIYTTDRKVPANDTSNWANFTSNSIACSNFDGQGITSLTDFGTMEKGPWQQIPYFYNNGEDDSKNGIWPDQGFATLCGGTCGVSFPLVIDRTIAGENGGSGALYSTGIEVRLTAYGPIVSRPTQTLFKNGEPLFGTFGTLVGIDGYLYTFAAITKTAKNNGLKMARVLQGSWSDISQYEFWSGREWTSSIPAYDDAGSNIFSWSEDLFGVQFGPGTGDLFFSTYYNRYLLFFVSDAPALDPNVYLSYSGELQRGWSKPKAIYTLPPVDDGYNYGFHAYANYDSTGKVIPLSWTQWSETESFHIAMTNVIFS
ncbi:hypothetical protein N431DRAFT_474773 [Stipitochalara longipes BDJ]|nr:hypothetical protein N431DRAFT_474773 [Stipitochalara longipes BDJ]